MAVTDVVVVSTGGQRQQVIGSTGVLSQASVDATTVVAGSSLDARAWRSLAYTIGVITHDVDWSVWGANASDYSDEVAVVSSTKVSAGANSSYAVAQAPFSYYRVKIASDVSSTAGTATVNGVLKG